MKRIPKVALFFETSAVNDRKIIRGIIKYSQHHGPWVFYAKMHPFYMMHGENLWRKKMLVELEKWHPDGIIAHVDNKKSNDLLKLGVPAILSPHSEPNCPGSYIFKNDEIMTGQMGAEYFLDLGFRNFAFCGYYNIYWSDELCKAFVERIAKAGFQAYVYKPSKPVSKNFLEEDKLLLCDWLTSLPKPVGLMTCNDARGQQVIDACNMGQLTVPDEVAVLGLENTDFICDVTAPPLSSISLGAEKAGYEVARLLDKILHSKRKIPPQKIFCNPTHVVTRQSTDILAIEDPEVAKAIRFIRTNRSKTLNVDDVVEVTFVSRRMLERRFKKILKRTIYEEIRRVQAERVAKMLLETDMPLYQIALALGYSSSKQIDLSFRKEKGMNPIQYRKSYKP